MRRPAGVTIVGTLLILGAIAGPVGTALVLLHPTPSNPVAVALARHASRVPLAVASAVSLAFELLEGVAGALLLRRRAAGRTVYVVTGGAAALFSVANTTVLSFVVLPVLLYALFVFLLYRPSATRWLRAGDA